MERDNTKLLQMNNNYKSIFAKFKVFVLQPARNTRDRAIINCLKIIIKLINFTEVWL